MNPFSPKSDELLTSPYINTAVSFMKIMRILEMITNIRSFDCYTNSSCHHQRKCVESQRVWQIWVLTLGYKGLNTLKTKSV